VPPSSKIVGTEHIMAGHVGGIGRDPEQADSLLGRQQGARGHVGLRLAVGTRSYSLPFNAILQQDFDRRFARNCSATKSIRKRSFTNGSGPSGGGTLLGYARVSKADEQNNAPQTKALRAGGCRHLFEETASGGRWDRPELHRLLDHLHEGETVVVWKLDWLSRSLKDVLHIMERIGYAAAGFRSIIENIDTTTPAGRMMMQMVGAFAEFERAMIRERTSAGLAAARAEGRVGGRRKKVDAAKRREIAESVVSGRKSGAEMARLYGVS
jgi:DNA invertase Pin-like site-specific DNA recombinase